MTGIFDFDCSERRGRERNPYKVGEGQLKTRIGVGVGV